MVTPCNAAAGIMGTFGGGADVLPGPGARGLGIFSLQGVGQVDVPKTVLQVTVVELLDGLSMLLEHALHGERQHGDSVLRAFPLSDGDLLRRAVDVLDP